MPSEKQSQIRTYFQIEARELINTLTEGSAQLDGSARPAELLQHLARAAHTLKGAAHVVGEPIVARLAHDFEEALAAYREAPTRDVAAQMLAVADQLAVETHGAGTAPPLAPTPAPAATASSLPDAVEELDSQQRTLRVELSETERLLNHVAETTRLVAGLRNTLDRAAGSSASDPAALLGTLADQLDHLDREAAELYRVSSQLRLISSETLLLDAGRMVRATAASLGRQVLCTTRGGTERIDVRVLEPLEGALLHLVRNAVAHGIEPEAERLRNGKPAAGTISVELLRSGHVIRLVCADDGRGIDTERIRAEAVRQGSLTRQQAAQLTQPELLELLFRSGFSTSSAVDEVSGRGIGLDAVRAAVSRLGGTVQVSSAPGEGTRFTLTVPQTLVAFRALLVSAGGRQFAVPFRAVEQTFLPAAHHKTVAQGEQGQTLFDGDDTMPFLRLNDAMPNVNAGIRGADGVSSATRESYLKLVANDARLVLAVDELGEVLDLLVRPLPPYVHALPFVAGASISASGEPMLVLDPDGLAHLAQTPNQRSAPSQRQAQPAASGPILVIDDSLTTRTLEQSILESEGYTVETANSAEQGLVLARQRQYALFLVDVEMPGMNGFDFVRTVQADPALRVTPSILVTSLDTPESRSQGRAAGAESYIVKGEFNQKIYLDRIRALIGLAPSRSSGVAR